MDIKKFCIKENCEVSICRSEDETPIIIFEDVPNKNIKRTDKDITVKLDIDNDIIDEVMETINLR